MSQEPDKTNVEQTLKKIRIAAYTAAIFSVLSFMTLALPTFFYDYWLEYFIGNSDDEEIAQFKELEKKDFNNFRHWPIAKKVENSAGIIYIVAKLDSDGVVRSYIEEVLKLELNSGLDFKVGDRYQYKNYKPKTSD